MKPSTSLPIPAGLSETRYSLDGMILLFEGVDSLDLLGLRLLWDRNGKGNSVIADEVTFKRCLLPEEAEAEISARRSAEERASAAEEQVKKLHAELEKLRKNPVPNQQVQPHHS